MLAQQKFVTGASISVTMPRLHRFDRKSNHRATRHERALQFDADCRGAKVVSRTEIDTPAVRVVA